MGEENMEVEDWDPSFLELLIQQEEIALSSCTQTGNLIQTQNRQTSSSSFLPPPPPQQQPLGFSPPRVFSQQATDYSSVTVENTINGAQVQFAAPRTPTRRRRASGNAKDLEIDRSKMERSASKMLTEKVDERLELKKETSKYKLVDSSKDVQATHLQRLKTPNLEPETPVAADQGAPQNFHNANALDAKPGMHRAESSLEDAGVQANLHTCLELSKKLQSIWAPPSDYNSGRSTISKLFVDCPTDFSVLFGFMRGDSSSKVCCLEVESSADVISQHSKHSFQRVDASKVSNFHSAITKVSDGMMPLEAIFEPLFDLCRVENDAITYRSLRILHALLKQLLTFERRSEGSALCSGKMSWLRDFILGAPLENFWSAMRHLIQATYHLV